VDSQLVEDTFYNMAIVSGEASDPDSTNNIDSVQIAIDCDIDSCNDITISTEVDQCGAVVDYNFSNCNIHSGSFFSVGTTTVNCEVTNSCGQTDSCSFEVTVIDSVPPVIDDCPQTLTIVACDVDALQNPSFSDTLTQSSYSQFSDSVNQGSAHDNCGIKSVVFVDSLSGECPYEIYRNWIVADSFENQSQCQQIITIQPDSLTLVCPQDTIITQCLNEQAISDLFWDWVDEAQMNGGCQADLVNIATEPPGICGGDSTVTFTAVDSCGQSIVCTATFSVQEPPAINAICPPDTVLFVDENCTFDISGQDLSAQIEGDCEISELTWEISGDTTLSGNDSLPNITLTKGTYIFSWGATGLCDETDCDFQLFVQDNQSPEITCPDGIDSLVQPGEDGLLLSLDSAVAWDNCGIAEVSNSFNQGGADASGFYAVGNTEVTFIATDNSGNSATCQTHIQIGVDSQDVELQIAGVIKTAFGVPVNNVSLLISGDKQKTAMTDSDGSYDFSVDFGDSIYVFPEKSGGWLDGVTTLDLIFIQRHILQIEFFHLPHQYISADMNDDGEISTLDLVVLQGLILGNTDTLAGNKSWRFIPEDFDFDNPNNPLNEDRPEDKNYPGINANLLEEDWVAVKTGDVSGDAGLSGIRETPISHDLELQEIRHPDQVIEWQIITSESDPLNGYQLEWQFPVGELEFTGWVNHLKTEDGTTMDGFYIDEESGIIRVLAYSGKKTHIADDGVLLSLFFESQGATQAVLELVEKGDRWESELYLKDGREVRLPRIKETRSVDEDAQFRLLQNRPNPFTAETTIGFILPRAGDYELSITNSSGKLIRQIEGEGKVGKNQIQINLDELTPGIYLYRLSSGEYSAVKKMLVH